MCFPCEPPQCSSFFRRMCFVGLVGACSLDGYRITLNNVAYRKPEGLEQKRYMVQVCRTPTWQLVPNRSVLRHLFALSPSLFSLSPFAGTVPYKRTPEREGHTLIILQCFRFFGIIVCPAEGFDFVQQFPLFVAFLL